MWWGGTRYVGANVALTAVYAGVGTVSLLLSQFTGLAAPVWPAAGVAFAVVYLRGWRLLPGVLVGSFLVNLPELLRGGSAVTTSVAVALAVAGGAALQALTGATLVERFVGDRLSLNRGGQVLAFLLLAGPVSCVVNPTIGVTAQLASGVIGAEQAGLGWLTWWVGDSIGVMVFAPLTLMALPDQAEIWHGRRWKVAVPSLVAVVVFVLLFLQSASQENQRLQEEARVLALVASSDLTRNALQHQEVLEGVGSYIDASTSVTADEFRTFTRRSLDRFPNLQALSWNPVVGSTELTDFEASQRRGQDRPDFTVTERGNDGELQPVDGGDDHVVITFIEPIDENRAALGFDIQSDPTRVQAINAARDSGEVHATAPIDLVQEQGTQKGMLALLPIYAGGGGPQTQSERRERLSGFAVGVYRLGDLLADTFAEARWDDVHLELIDISAGANGDLIADRPAVTPPVIDPAVPDGRRAVGEPIDVFGRTWQLAVTPTSGPLASAVRPAAPSHLVSGLLVIGLLEAFLLLLTGLERKARREADVSTFDAEHDPLTGLLNRRAFLHLLTTTRQRGIDEGSAHALLYLDLDGFKSVNDIGGHEAGDRLLSGVAAILEEKVRSRDIVARLGGDEFAIILQNCQQERALAIAADIVSAIGGYSITGADRELAVGVSVGVASVDGTEKVGIDELVRRADTACYEAKRAGKGQVRLHQPTTQVGQAPPNERA